MPIFQARKLLNYSTVELKRKLRGFYRVQFDDELVETTAADLIISRSAWNIHVAFPETPLLSSMRIAAIKPSGYLSLKDFQELSNRCFWPAYDASKYDNRDELSRLVYEGANDLYNTLVSKTMPYMQGLDAADLVEITNHPEIRRVVESCDESPESIAYCYDVAEGLILLDPELQDNRQAIALRSSTINMTQALQTTVIRGHMQDINTRVFPKPVMRPYVAGIRTVYESMIESRGAAISLSNSQAPLQQSEYFSRRLQQLNMNFRNLHPGDCGSSRTILFPVKKDIKDASGAYIERSNLTTLEGKYYYTDSGELKQVSKKDKHLEGSYIRMRSIVGCCEHPDPYGVCAVCYGGLADTIPEKTSISHITAALLMQIFGQGILSLKHRIGSASADSIILDDMVLKFMRTSKGSNDIFLTDEVKQRSSSIELTADAVPGLVDLKDMEDYERMGITRISSFEAMTLIQTYTDNKGIEWQERTILPVSDGNRKASLSYEALEFIKAKDFSTNAKNVLTIDLEDWNIKQAFLTMPATQYSISEHRDDVSRLIEGTAKEIRRRETTDTPEKVLLDLCDLVNSRLNVNVSILEAILFGGMAISMNDKDYALPKAWTPGVVGVLADVIAGRGLGGVFCYEDQVRQMDNVTHFIELNRLDHPMDVYFCPEALEHELSLANRAY